MSSNQILFQINIMSRIVIKFLGVNIIIFISNELTKFIYITSLKLFSIVFINTIKYRI